VETNGILEREPPTKNAYRTLLAIPSSTGNETVASVPFSIVVKLTPIRNGKKINNRILARLEVYF
jgi:hypothetical protein